ncbi:hypothetical protein ABIE41_000157 [Bosea sp. OAE506]
MLEFVLTFSAVIGGMLMCSALGWQIGRIMTPRPSDLREQARLRFPT